MVAKKSESHTTTPTPSRVEHYDCAVAGLGTVAVFVLLVLPLVGQVRRNLGVFATTVIVFMSIAVWSITWIMLEIVWELRAGQLNL